MLFSFYYVCYLFQKCQIPHHGITEFTSNKHYDYYSLLMEWLGTVSLHLNSFSQNVFLGKQTGFCFKLLKKQEGVVVELFLITLLSINYIGKSAIISKRILLVNALIPWRGIWHFCWLRKQVQACLESYVK